MLPVEADHNMIEAAYTLIETMKKGTPDRDRRLVATIWAAMVEVAPKPRASGLTDLQRRTHEIIAAFIQDNGMSPSYDEIGRQLGKGKSDVHDIIHAMKRRGVLTLRGGSKRSIRLIVQPGEPVKGP